MSARPASTATFGEIIPSPYVGRRMSLEEFERLPEQKPALEYWDGVVLQKALAKRKHLRLQRELDVALALYSQRSGGDSGPEASVYFEGQMLVPDLAYWAPGKPQGDDDRMLAPTLAIEIRSPGESVVQQRQKCQLMRAGGVDVCWFIDPERRVADVFEGELDGARVAEDMLTSAYLPGFELSLAQLWASLDA